MIQAFLVVHLAASFTLGDTQAGIVTAARTQTAVVQNTCGWVGVTVGPMTPAFAQSLGMAQPYGAIFNAPQPGSPAAAHDIEQGDVLLAINGTPLARARDFASTISMIAPGDEVHFDMVRNGDPIQRKMVVGAVRCRTRR